MLWLASHTKGVIVRHWILWWMGAVFRWITKAILYLAYQNKWAHADISYISFEFAFVLLRHTKKKPALVLSRLRLKFKDCRFSSSCSVPFNCESLPFSLSTLCFSFTCSFPHYSVHSASSPVPSCHLFCYHAFFISLVSFWYLNAEQFLPSSSLIWPLTFLVLFLLFTMQGAGSGVPGKGCWRCRQECS